MTETEKYDQANRTPANIEKIRLSGFPITIQAPDGVTILEGSVIESVRKTDIRGSRALYTVRFAITGSILWETQK